MSGAIQYRDLPQALIRAREAVARYFRPGLKQAGVTEQQWRVIRALSQSGEMEVGRISEISCIPGPSLTGVLERMERDDLVRRFRISTDQRKVLIELTAKSRKLVEKVAARINARYELIEQHLGPQVLAQLFTLLDKVAELPDPNQAEPVKLPIARRKSPARPAAKAAARR